MKVVVTQKNIDEATRNSSTSCAIAQALKEKYPNEKVSVGMMWVIRVGDKRYKHTKKSSDFVSKFDAGKEVEPTTFDFKLMK